MKSQDILLLFKLASLHAQEENLFGRMEMESVSDTVEALWGPREPEFMAEASPFGQALVSYSEEGRDFQWHNIEATGGDDERWEGWSEPVVSTPISSWGQSYSLRALSASLGLSKSEVSKSMVRCRESGLLTNDYETSHPKVNLRELLKIIEHALKYFFPVRPGAIARGIPTGFAAPALSKSLKSAGGLIPVWPDALGSDRGQAIEPLYKTVPDAVKKDRILYHYLALADAARLGGPRECGVAINILRAGMGLQ